MVEDWPLRADHLNLNILLSTEELSKFKQRMEDTSRKAREGENKLGVHISKLSKFMEALRSRSVKGVMSCSMKSGANLLKIGKQRLRNLGDHESEKLVEKAKIFYLGLKKQVCTSMLIAPITIVEKHQVGIPEDRDALRLKL